MEDQTYITLWMLTLLAFLEAIALYLGIDGAYFMPVLVIIAGVGGYEIKRYRDGES